MLQLCGVPHPGHRIDGRSLAFVLKSSKFTSPHEAFQWQLGKQWVVREGNWKLCHELRDTSDGKERNKTIKGSQLFDIGADPGEKTDLAKANPDVVKRLTGRYEEWKKTWREGVTAGKKETGEKKKELETKEAGKKTRP